MSSPFIVIEEFISPKLCEQLVTNLSMAEPSRLDDGQPIKYERFLPEDYQTIILETLSQYIPKIEEKYQGQVFSKPGLLFQEYWENEKAPAETHGCENSVFKRKKWDKIKDVDLVGFIWLKDYHNSVPLDPRTEVYGGKLEFPAYDFSLTPARGTLVIYPATPHFVTAVSHVHVGSLEKIKVSIPLRKAGLPWAYNPVDYPGTYRDWFSEE